jgi:hypothetical protein
MLEALSKIQAEVPSNRLSADISALSIEEKCLKLEQQVAEQTHAIADLKRLVNIVMSPSLFLERELGHVASLADVHNHMVAIKAAVMDQLDTKVHKSTLQSKIRLRASLKEMAELQDAVDSLQTRLYAKVFNKQVSTSSLRDEAPQANANSSNSEHEHEGSPEPSTSNQSTMGSAPNYSQLPPPDSTLLETHCYCCRFNESFVVIQAEFNNLPKSTWLLLTTYI